MLVVVSTVKAEGVESSIPSYMCHGEVSIVSYLFGSKSKDKGKMKAEDTISDDSDHQTNLSTIVLNWTDPESD